MLLQTGRCLKKSSMCHKEKTEVIILPANVFNRIQHATGRIIARNNGW